MMKILIVDDDTFLSDMYSMKFAERGHSVTNALHAAEALKILEKDDSFDLVLTDMIMPGMTGVELLKKIKSIFQDTKMKFIILSNQGQDQDIEEATSAGAIGYIIKAHSVPSEVVGKVEYIMSHK